MPVLKGVTLHFPIFYSSGALSPGQTPLWSSKNVLQGQHSMAWNQVLHEHFSEPVDVTVPMLVAQDCNLEENFNQALQLFIQRMLNKKNA
jgi:hypothetical protein